MQVVELWRDASVDGSKYVAVVAAEGVDRGAQQAAACIMSLGYEAGMWDLLGTVNVARKALESISGISTA